MLSFLAAVFFLLITPGPGVLSTAGVGSAYGRAAGHRYVFGLLLGTNMVALAVVTGLAGVMLSIPVLRAVLLIASVLYLLYLASRIALAGSNIGFIHVNEAPGIINGVALQAINPKAYVVNTALFSGFQFLPGNPILEILLKFLMINLVWIPVHLLWLAAGIKLKSLALPARQQRLINYAMAAALVIVVVLALASELL